MKTFFFIQIPLRHPQEPVHTTNSKKNKGGRLEDPEQLEAFEKTYTYFEFHEEKQLTLSELVDIMQKNLESSDISAYTKVLATATAVKRIKTGIKLINTNPKFYPS